VKVKEKENIEILKEQNNKAKGRNKRQKECVRVNISLTQEGENVI
jgi:hypothetical protein